METTLDFIKQKTDGFQPEIGIILGSGLGSFAQGFPSVSVPYCDIPGFKTPTVEGHKGQFVFAEIAGKKAVLMQGRYHLYEGNSAQDVTFPVKVMKKLGVKTLIITNAAGAINKKFKPGDLMLITDHINLMGVNPLSGANDDSLGTRFPDMSEIYKKDLLKTAENCAKKLGLKVKKGVYSAFSGPSYETPAEINFLRKIGADAVGMSTIPEAIVANWCSMKVLGISCITNYAAGTGKTGLSHAEVIENSDMVKEKFSALLLAILKSL